ncbi:hypothetical protein ONS95_000960 [Cadophora gregata]|uniref:uncharacterized protein n=1 Tax=Cadophora gregata TaxID=51156 RepID=UPI0026DB52CD|nr:uncharacterized protein ONS95_000960 [Cadophora gregata]KAK0102842.1 hypothetical protein ONS96_005474 [Cadophora gregata f. sp. sojae]KAK0129020.1 hypothetical protein ONS95_000960 [Cadophora gregata]
MSEHSISDSENEASASASGSDSSSSESRQASPSPSPTPPLDREFTIFSLLPPELRRKIWTHTFPPRLLPVNDWHTPSLWNRGGLPIALHVNEESRDLVHSLYPMVDVAKSRFNTETDTMILSGWTERDLMRYLPTLRESELAGRIRLLALSHALHWHFDEHRVWGPRAHLLEALESTVRAMTGLKELIIVYEIRGTSGNRKANAFPRFSEKLLDHRQPDHYDAQRQKMYHLNWDEIREPESFYSAWTNAKVYPVYGYIGG